MNSKLDIKNIIIERIELSFDETHHLYDGVPLYEKKFELAMSFHPPGVAAVKDEGGAYHINIRGNPLYKKRFLKTFGFYDGLAAVIDDSGSYHININGEPACIIQSSKKLILESPIDKPIRFLLLIMSINQPIGSRATSPTVATVMTTMLAC